MLRIRNITITNGENPIFKVGLYALCSDPSYKEGELEKELKEAKDLIGEQAMQNEILRKRRIGIEGKRSKACANLVRRRLSLYFPNFKD